MGTRSGELYYVCETAQESDLNQAGFEALTWVLIGGVKEGGWPSGGREESIAEYVLQNGTVEKGKGAVNYGGGEVEIKFDADDVGQVALRTLAATKSKYAFKAVRTDAVSGYTATTDYYRGVITGPVALKSEEFDVDKYTLGYVQTLTINPEAVSA